jgi:hypothetical protein
LEILEYCEPKDVIAREQYYIVTLNPQYNILQTAGSSLGYKHREETIVKFKARRHTEETKAKILASIATSISVSVTDLETNVTTIYASAAQAAKAIGCRHKAVLERVHNSQMGPYKGKFIINLYKS